MTELEIKNQCRIVLLENLGFTCKEDDIILDEYYLVGVNDDILDEVNFKVLGGKHFKYYYNSFTAVFKIESQHYDGYIVS